MTQLTEERFEEILSKRLALLASKEDLATGLAATEKRIIKRIDTAQEELAVMVANGFEDIQTRLDVTAKIQTFELKFKKLEEALHIRL
jgi:hypothetical protein